MIEGGLRGITPDQTRRLREDGLISHESPFWWETDYKPDPREYMPYDEFASRLVHIGEAPIAQGGATIHEKITTKDIYLYPYPQVPMTSINLDIEGETLPFMVTARPFHEKEHRSRPYAKTLWEHNIEDLPDFVKNGGTLDLPSHFLPHVRGLISEQKDNTLFWHAINEGWPKNYYEEIKRALDQKGLGYIDVYKHRFSDTPTFPGLWDELKKRPALFSMKLVPEPRDWDSHQLTPAEFLQEYKSEDRKSMLYPFNGYELSQTLPLFISNLTHEGSRIRKPAALGILADNGLIGRVRQRGLSRIMDRDLAFSISEGVTKSLGVETDTILFTPQKGKPKYERISAF